MPIEQNNNISLKKADSLDSRLSTVTSVVNLPDPTVLSNFLYVGAKAYVSGLDSYYKVVNILGILTWVPVDTVSLVRGSLTILSTDTVLNLSNVTPAIETCYAVDITISGTPVSATISSISNFPGENKHISFYVEAGKKIKFIHNDYDVATTDQIVIEHGFSTDVIGRSIGNDSMTFRKHGVAICQVSAVQFTKASQWAQNLLAGAVDNNLTSISTTKALSANQGRVLDGKIAGKENTFIKGNRITLSGTTLKVDPATWVRLANPSPGRDLSNPGVTMGWLITLVTTITKDTYHYVYADNGIYDQGTWMLPAGSDGTTASSWVLIGGNPAPLIGVVEYDFVTNDSGLLGSQLIGDQYFTPVDITTAYGDTSIISLIFDTDGLADKKVSFGFSKSGTYTVEANLTLVAESGLTTSRQDILDNISKLSLLIYKTNGVKSSFDPSSGGIVSSIESLTYRDSTSYGATDNAYVDVRLKTTFVLPQSLAINSAFTISLDSPQDLMDWTDIKVRGTYYNKLKITKHK
mgnify:CR=1 FL=1